MASSRWGSSVTRPFDEADQTSLILHQPEVMGIDPKPAGQDRLGCGFGGRETESFHRRQGGEVREKGGTDVHGRCSFI